LPSLRRGSTSNLSPPEANLFNLNNLLGVDLIFLQAVTQLPRRDAEQRRGPRLHPATSLQGFDETLPFDIRDRAGER
jgi:hypothetical protein